MFLGGGLYLPLFLIMPFSYDYFKQDFYNHMVKEFDHNLQILDVGAGAGTYGRLLGKYFTSIDALEAYPQYIEEFELTKVYRNVYCADLRIVGKIEHEYLILGDIIEHLTIEEAQEVLNNIHTQEVKCMVAVPYLMPQGAVGGNELEIHKQEDLTHKIVLQRYHMLHVLFKNEYYGYYINY